MILNQFLFNESTFGIVACGGNVSIVRILPDALLKLLSSFSQTQEQPGR